MSTSARQGAGMRRRSTKLPFLVVALAVSLTSCSGGSGDSSGSSTTPAAGSTTTRPTAGTGATSTPRPISSQVAKALGNPRTLDPCSLMAQVGATPAGTAAFADPQSMDYCTVTFQTAGGDVELHLGQLVDTPPAGASPRAVTPLAGGAIAVQGTQDPTTCLDRVDFADRVSLLAVALPPYGTNVVGTCAVADAGLAAALTVIAAGGVGHRTYPAHSFGPVDACSALTPAAVRRVLPALAKASPVTYPARHQCGFGSTGSTTTYAALVLGAAYQRFDGGPTSTTIKVAGHPVVLIPTQPTGRATECTGYSPHIAYPSRSGQPAMEMAELHVSLPDGAPAAQACKDVKALAATVFARLP
jgi:hypothetical protein